jgi:hypothetical protein
MFRAAAICSCVSLWALRRSCSVISSARSSFARAAILARRSAGMRARISAAVFMSVSLLSVPTVACSNRCRSGSLWFLFYPCQMRRKSRVSQRDKVFIELLLIQAVFVATTKDDCGTVRIKSKRKSPDAIALKPKFLHVRKRRRRQCIHRRATEGGAKTLQHDYARLKLVLNFDRKCIVFGFEIPVKDHVPWHGEIMSYMPYGFKYILLK